VDDVAGVRLIGAVWLRFQSANKLIGFEIVAFDIKLIGGHEQPQFLAVPDWESIIQPIIGNVEGGGVGILCNVQDGDLLLGSIRKIATPLCGNQGVVIGLLQSLTHFTWMSNA
jgi:hypothetical protein